MQEVKIHGKYPCVQFFVYMMKKVVHGIIADLLDNVDSQEFDFAVEIAPHVPSALFCHLIGAPMSDRELVAECSTSVLKVFRADLQYRDEIEAGTQTLVRYVRDHIERKRANPGADALSRLIEAEQRGETDMDEIVAILFTLLTASTDNSSAGLSQMIMAFAEHPDQWDLLRQNPAWITKAVMESSRMRPGMWSDPRFVHEEQEFGGVTIPGGTWLFASIIASNHDPLVFEAPDVFMIDRKHPRPIFNFGFGPHACPGRPAALVELEETLRLFVERFSRIEIIGVVVLDGHPHGDYIRSLPIRITPA